jgi:drug/metabolite transporter (DMT)-like permease
MTSNEKEPARQMTGRRRPLGYRFWTGAVLAVVGIALVLASSAGSLSQANALRVVTIGVALELVSILLLFCAGAPSTPGRGSPRRR